MTLRLALVIEGDPSGARKALDDTARAVEQLGARTEAAGDKAASAAKKWDWESREETIARLGLGLDEVAEATDRVDRAAGQAAPQVAGIGQAAATAAPKFEALKIAALGLVAGFAVGALSEGFRLAIGAARALFEEVLSATPGIERDLKRHAELVRAVKAAYAEAAGAASTYGEVSAAQLRFSAQQNVARLEESLQAAMPRFGGPLGGTGVFADVMQTRLGPFTEVVQEFRRALADGTADVIAFRREVAAIAETLPDDSPFRRLAETALEDTARAAEVTAELARARDVLAGLAGDADAAATALGGKAERYGELKDAVERALPPLREMDTLLRSIGGQPRLPRSGATAAVDPTLGLTGGLTGFAAGGFTGHGPADRVAGLVHGGEYVFDAASTARLGVANLDAIRAGIMGYAAGGIVGPAARTGERGGLLTALAGDFSVLSGAMRSYVSVLIETRDRSSALNAMFAALGSGIANLGGRLFERGLKSLLGFSAGGFTGHGPASRIAGVVHGGEYVFDAASTARLGVANLDAIRSGVRGYAGGGFVGTIPAGPATGRLAITVNVNGARGNAEIRQMVAEGVDAGIRRMDAALPVRVAEIIDDPRAR